MTRRRAVIEADTRGRVSLAKFGIKNMPVVVDELEDGGVIIQPAFVFTEAELRHYNNQEAMDELEVGLDDLNEDRVSRPSLRSERLPQD